MKLAFIGAGYVGLASAAGYANLGNECVCIDIDEGKVAKINRGEPPIYEDGLEPLLKKLIKSGKMRASTDYSAANDAEMIFICVGTPSLKNGGIDLAYIEKAGGKIGELLKNTPDFKVVVVKSTVVPGTTAEKVRPILESRSGKIAGKDFGLAMLPEFLKEGSALEDFKAPDRIVLGCEDERTLQALRKLHEPFKCPKLEVSLSTAEMIKYASNAFLAAKISFINQLANLCERTGINVDDVAEGMGLDKRIAPYFLKAGPGFGGSCFPKDVKALMAFSNSKGVEPLLLEAAMEINYLQPMRLIELASEEIDLKGKRVAILGLAFKPNTDDVRESPAIPIVGELLKLGCEISAYDPKGMENFRKIYSKVRYADSMENALKGAEACFIVTDWNEFKKPLQFFEKHMKNPLVVDGRRILDPESGKNAIYRALGRGK